VLIGQYVKSPFHPLYFFRNNFVKGRRSTEKKDLQKILGGNSIFTYTNYWSKQPGTLQGEYKLTLKFECELQTFTCIIKIRSMHIYINKPFGITQEEDLKHVYSKQASNTY
jgi:hypothetical protein